MNWLDDYKSKLCTADEAVRLVKSGDRIYYGGNAAIPRALIDALARRAPDLTDVRLAHVLLIGDDPLSAPGMEKSFRHHSMFVGPADRAAVNEGRADYVPVFLHQIPRLFEDRVFLPDLTMVMVSPPDSHGFMSLGVEVLDDDMSDRIGKPAMGDIDLDPGGFYKGRRMSYRLIEGADEGAIR